MSVKFYINLKNSVYPQSENPALIQSGLSFKGNNGACVILIHGLTGTPNEMGFLAKYFNRKGYSVVCPRLANHGEPIQILKKTKWQDCYKSVCDSLFSLDKDIKQVFVAGLSMGALLALLLAQEFPEKILGVSCLSPTLFYDGWNTPWSKCLLPLTYITPLKHFFYFKEEPPYGIKNEAVSGRVHKHYKNAKLNDLNNVANYGYPYFPVVLLYQLHLLVKYTINILPRINTPVQLLQAKDDDMTSVKNSRFIHDKISSKIKEIILFYDSYHVLTADNERDKVAQSMDNFFSRLANQK